MIYFYSFLLIIIIFLLYMRFEASMVKIERVRFTKSNRGLKIIQLSDIHMRFLKIPFQKVRNIIQSENPDIIIITGDYIDTPRQVKDFINFLDQIRGNIPVYLCMGNHDHKTFNIAAKSRLRPRSSCADKEPSSIDEFIEALENKNINVLHNRAVCIQKNSKKYNLIGIDDLNAGKPCIEKALKTCDKAADINIAFSHNPDIIFEVPRDKVDYLFCGHFHGGQIWMPFNFEYKLLRNERLCKMGISRGLHKFKSINLYISRGLGNVCFPLRFLSRPEITVFYMP